MSSEKKATVFSIDGKEMKTIKLPEAFSTRIEGRLIKRAVLAIESHAKQPQGVKPGAGRDNTAIYRGSRWLPTSGRSINTDRARLPRMKNRGALLSGKVASVPQAVGGPRVRVPHANRAIAEKINRKERKKAFLSAIASTAEISLVGKRHKVPEKLMVPVVIENKFEESKKTREVIDTLEKIGIYIDVLDAKSKRKIRAGKGKMRGRKYKTKKSILIISAKDSTLLRAAQNLEGVDACSIANLNTAMLAPGAMPGRLTVWTEDAIKAVGEKK